jgi:hypothetical protein
MEARGIKWLVVSVQWQLKTLKFKKEHLSF